MKAQKAAIITGGCKGIGWAVSRRLAAEGYALALLGTSGPAACSQAFSWLREHEIPYLYVQGSVADPAARRELLEETIEHFGRVDVLINNAGVAPRMRLPVLEMTEESYDRVMDINLKGAVFLSQQTARQMRCQAPRDGVRGIIVNISSISAEVVSVSRGEYCMSKAGLSMWTQLLAASLAEDEILVYEVRPGIIETAVTRPVKEKYDAVCASEALLTRRWGQPEDVAEAVALFCTGKLSYSTGQVLYVDGGFTQKRL